MKRPKRIRSTILTQSLVLVFSACTMADSGGNQVSDWQEKWNRLNPSVADELLDTQLVAARLHIHAPVDAALSLLSNPEKEELGRRLLLGLESVSLLAVNSPTHIDANARVWLLNQQVESLLNLRLKWIQQLRLALENKTLLREEGEFRERKLPQVRVCDQAWVMLEQILRADEDKVNLMVDRDAFLHLPISERDEIIRKMQLTFNQ